MWKEVCESWYNAAPNGLEELLQFIAKENCRSHVNALWSHRRDMSLCMISSHAITLKVVSKGIPVLECPGKFSERNLIEDVLNIIEK